MFDIFKLNDRSSTIVVWYFNSAEGPLKPPKASLSRKMGGIFISAFFRTSLGRWLEGWLKFSILSLRWLGWINSELASFWNHAFYVHELATTQVSSQFPIASITCVHTCSSMLIESDALDIFKYGGGMSYWNGLDSQRWNRCTWIQTSYIENPMYAVTWHLY